MTPDDQSKSYPIVISRVKRKEQVFGTSALELMLVVTFLVLLMLLAYFSDVVARAGTAGPEQAAEQPGDSPGGKANDHPGRIAELEKALATAQAETRRSEEGTAKLREQNRKLSSTAESLGGKPNTLPEQIENLERRLATALAEKRRAEADAAKLRRSNRELASIVQSQGDNPQGGKPNPLPDLIADLVRRLKTALAEKRRSEGDLAEQRRRNRELAGLVEILTREPDDGTSPEGEHNWPPIIRLAEADGYWFATNSSEITGAFAARLRENVVPRIVEIAREFQTNTIDIVGHTDERPIAGFSNLDEQLVNFLNLRASSPLVAADNAGLGFARAAAVARLLARAPALRQFRVVPMSGAQVILPQGTIADGSDPGDVPTRRRIEIRLRRGDG